MSERPGEPRRSGWRLGGRDSDLTLDVTEVDGTDVVTVSGDLDARTHGELRELFKDPAALTRPRVVLDLDAVGFLDSAGIGALVVANRAGAARGAALSLVATQPRVLKLLGVVGLDRVLPVHGTLAEALAAASR